ncbi:MAG: helix-turn-helix transcriptional regulator [Bacteroidetes bacterium]|nr:helix-turn-helix transcriptional regulator [Bacteroidota bacterium]
MYEFKEKIKKLRIEKGLKQADVARAAGIKQATLASIEKPVELDGTKAMTIETGKGIAKALGVPFNELFDIEIPETKKIEELRADLDTAFEMVNVQREMIKLLNERNEANQISLLLYEKMLAFAMGKMDKHMIYTIPDLREIALNELLKQNPKALKGKVYNPVTGQFESKQS